MSVSTALRQTKNCVNNHYLCLALVLTGGITPALAVGNGTTLATLAQNVTKTYSSFVFLITGGAYVVGFALAMVGILKLKAHKDNPTQIPISTGFALLFVGSALVFLPTLLGVGISTIFGDIGSGEVSACGTDKLIW